jgi:heparosan-N-sulfate-glucuronate 5-epimerase
VGTLKRLALGFPLQWSHRRACSLAAISQPGQAPYFIEWDPSNGVYGEDWENAPRDPRGVLLIGPSRWYHPILISQYALHRFSIWHSTGDARARDDFLAQAAWLRDRQSADGVPGLYRFEFPWVKYGAGVGWCSAMAQGEAISVLLRADSIAPEQGFGEAAVLASLPFYTDIGSGGVVWRDGRDCFFEEIANEHAPHVLNGCVFALWGLWELWKRTRDEAAGRLVDGCVATLQRWLPFYDTGWWTLYSLMRSATGTPHVATLKYHQFHIAQMRVLGAMFDASQFAQAAERWTAYVERPKSRMRVIGAALRSLPERALGYDTVRGGASARLLG